MSELNIEAINKAIAADNSKQGPTLCLAGNTSDAITVETVDLDGKQQLALVVRNKDGAVISGAPKGDSAAIVTVRLPACTIEQSFDADPETVAKYWKPETTMIPSTAFFFGPAGDVDTWHARMKPITTLLAQAYGKAIVNHTTLIPGDSTSARVKKLDKNVRKEISDESEFDDAFGQQFAADFLVPSGSPHAPHLADYVAGNSTTVRFRSNLYKKKDENVEGPYDAVVGEKVLQSMRDKFGPGVVSPLPLYMVTSAGTKRVTPEKYSSVANRLRGATAYAVVGGRIISSPKNKVQSLKFWLDKLIVIELGPKRGDSSSGVVDLSGLVPKRPADDAESDDDVLAVAAGKKKAKYSDDEVSDGFE